jgi:membrane associated rhomboid family serine protease
MHDAQPLQPRSPLHDEAAPPRRVFTVTATLIFMNIFVFFLVESRIFGDPLTIKRGFAVIPRVLFGEAELRIPHAPPALTLVTSMFLHSSYLHLLGNMAFLFIFGSAVEAAMDSFFFLLFYVSCGVASALLLAYTDPGSISPYIGASGAISGVCAAYLLLYARFALEGIAGGFLKSFHAQAWLLVGGWILLQFYDLAFVQRSHVAFVAHVGGIIVGLACAPLFSRRARRAPSAPAQKREAPPPSLPSSSDDDASTP